MKMYVVVTDVFIDANNNLERETLISISTCKEDLANINNHLIDSEIIYKDVFVAEIDDLPVIQKPMKVEEE